MLESKAGAYPSGETYNSIKAYDIELDVNIVKDYTSIIDECS
jgi:hypothetical protein